MNAGIDSKNILSKTVKDYNIDGSSNINNILTNMLDSGGFEGRNLANGISILRNMIAEKNCTKFLSFVGSLISTGNIGIVKDMVKHNYYLRILGS